MASWDCNRRRIVWLGDAIEEIQHIAQSIDLAFSDNMWRYFGFMSDVADEMEKMAETVSKYLAWFDYEPEYDENDQPIEDENAPAYPDPFIAKENRIWFEDRREIWGYDDMDNFCSGYREGMMYRYQFIQKVMDHHLAWITEEVLEGYLGDSIGYSILYALARVRRAVSEQYALIVNQSALSNGYY